MSELYHVERPMNKNKKHKIPRKKPHAFASSLIKLSDISTISLKKDISGLVLISKIVEPIKLSDSSTNILTS